MMKFSVVIVCVLFGVFILPQSIDSIPVIPLEAGDGIAEDQVYLILPKGVETIDGPNKKSTRQFNFLNNLISNFGGNLLNPNRVNTPSPNRNNTNNNGVEATTRRLSGRPGLGFIPDVNKGVETILNGVAAGNLEQILEGSFVFAPTGVQLVAGNVLDQVFRSTSTSTNSPASASVSVSADTTTSPASVVFSPGPTFIFPTTTGKPESQPQPMFPSDAIQKQLQQLIQQQQQLNELQALLQAQVQNLQNSQGVSAAQ